MNAHSALRHVAAVCLALSGCEADVEPEALSWAEARRQFVANDFVANKELHGKPIEWTGTVSVTSQRLEHRPGLYVVLEPEPGNKSTAFVAWFPDTESDAVRALHLGQQVRVRCRLNHMSTKFLEVAISLDSCRVAWATPLASEEAIETPEPTQTTPAP